MPRMFVIYFTYPTGKGPTAIAERAGYTKVVTESHMEELSFSAEFCALMIPGTGTEQED